MDWKMIQKKCEENNLTSKEAKALIQLAQAGLGVRFCEWCGWETPRHENDCPVRILGEIKTNEN